MKGIVITPDALRIMSDMGHVATTLHPGNLVDALWSASRWYRDNGCPALADFYCEKATLMMRTKWYQDWSMAL